MVLLIKYNATRKFTILRNFTDHRTNTQAKLACNEHRNTQCLEDVGDIEISSWKCNHNRQLGSVAAIGAPGIAAAAVFPSRVMHLTEPPSMSVHV